MSLYYKILILKIFWELAYLARVDVADDDQVDVKLLLLTRVDVSVLNPTRKDDGDDRWRKTYPILAVEKSVVVRGLTKSKGNRIELQGSKDGKD